MLSAANLDVDMLLLYGEGSRAFLRLQEEVMRVSGDRSIFAWVDSDVAPESLDGLLARGPKAFSRPSKWRHRNQCRPASGGGKDGSWSDAAHLVG